jgi:endoglucanase
MYFNLSKLLLLAALLCVSISGITGYTVRGNKLYDPTGAKVTIKGMCRPSFEWNAVGEKASLDDYSLMRNMWGANSVRISLNQDFWFASSSYAATIDQQIAWVRQLNMGVILDLHWNNGGQQKMADRKSISFWSQVAARYKNNDWVMFELYNEPHDVSWDQWLNGDSEYAGMQNMYDAVRAAGADNVVVVGGLNWAFDLSGVQTGYAVRGDNIAYATHPYDFPGKQLADWPAAFGFLTQTAPIIMTEFGQYCATGTYVADLLNYAEALGIHWTAWAWYVQGCAFPSIISDWNGTPYPGVGETIKRYMSSQVPTVKPGSTSAPISTAPTSAPVASGSLSVFAGALQSGWQDWSWSTSYTLADNQFTRAGSKSIRFEAVKYQGVYLHATSAFAVSSYAQFVFYINGGTSNKAGSNVGVKLYSSSGLVIGETVSLSVAITANTWTQVAIPISSFGVSASTTISGFAIQSTVDGSVGNIWISDIAFVPATASAPATQAPAVTPKATQAPSTQAPAVTPKATQAPATQAPSTQAPSTQAPSTQAPVVTPKATQAPVVTAKPTSAPATQAPSTQAPVVTAKPTSPPSNGGGCDASSIRLVQVVSGSWDSNGKQVTQYSVEVKSSCTTKTLVALTLSASNYSPVNAWNINGDASSLTLPNYATATPAQSFSFGYQNTIGQASFTITSVTFQ